MRVIGGELRRRNLVAPPGQGTRPSSDKLRETLFNILGAAVRDCQFIDAYAGSGAVGIEALSRGARRVVFIESDPGALRALRANLRELRLQAEVLALPVLRALPRLSAGGQPPCDFFFLDPPYQLGQEYERVLGVLDQLPELAGPATRIIAECRKGAAWRSVGTRWRLTRVHPQGESELRFLAAQPQLPPPLDRPLAAAGRSGGPRQEEESG